MQFILYCHITRKSAPLVKVNLTYMKHRLVLSIELGTVQTGTGKIDPALKFKCTTAPVTSKVGYILHFTFSRCLVHNVI